MSRFDDVVHCSEKNTNIIFNLWPPRKCTVTVSKHKRGCPRNEDCFSTHDLSTSTMIALTFKSQIYIFLTLQTHSTKVLTIDTLVQIANLTCVDHSDVILFDICMTRYSWTFSIFTYYKYQWNKTQVLGEWPSRWMSWFVQVFGPIDWWKFVMEALHFSALQNACIVKWFLMQAQYWSTLRTVRPVLFKDKRKSWLSTSQYPDPLFCTS